MYGVKYVGGTLKKYSFRCSSMDESRPDAIKELVVGYVLCICIGKF